MKSIIKKLIFTALWITLSGSCYGKLVNLKQCDLNTQSYSDKNHTKSIYFLSGLISNSNAYEKLIKTLNKQKTGFNLISVDLPPAKQSSLKHGYSWKNMQSCLLEYFLKKKNFILVLHDLSSAIMLPIFQNLNEMPMGIVLLNSIIRPSEYRYIYPLTLLKDKSVGMISSAIFPKFLYQKELKALAIHNTSLVNGDVFDQVLNLNIASSSKEIGKLIQGFPTSVHIDQKIKHSLGNPNIKQLVIWGLGDPILKNQLQFLDETSKHPYREMFLLKKARHFLMWEHAREISSVLLSWLSKNKM